MTLFELQEYCLANAVDGVISGDRMTVDFFDSSRPIPLPIAPIVGRGYLDEPTAWITLD
jgi:hypothetical protein